MPRLFNLEVFNETVTGDATTPAVYYSVREHQAVLGSADVHHAQIIVEAIGDAGTVVTLAYQISNTGNEAEWTSSARSTTVTPAAFTAVPFTGWLLVDRARFEEYDQAVADITWMESFWTAYMSLLAERATEVSSTSSCQCAFVPQRRPWGDYRRQHPR